MIVKEINGVSRSFEFGMYTLKILADDTGVTNLNEVMQRLAKSDLPFMTSFLFACAKNACRIEKKEVDFKLEDVYDWVDSLGGYSEFLSMIEELAKAYKIKNQKAPETGQSEQQP